MFAVPRVIRPLDSTFRFAIVLPAVHDYSSSGMFPTIASASDGALRLATCMHLHPLAAVHIRGLIEAITLTPEQGALRIEGESRADAECCHNRLRARIRFDARSASLPEPSA
jgi:hypothetical protein